MSIEEVLELLEIDSPDEFEYFEHLAELLEYDEFISYEDFYTVLKEVEPDMLSELLDNYFEDIFLGIPDDASDFFTHISTIKQYLIGMAKQISSADSRRLFTDELYKFRNWYAFDSLVHCKNVKNNRISDLPVVEALALYRMEKLGEESYEYDFLDCPDFPMEEYSITFSYKISDLDEEDDDNEINEDEEYFNSLIDKTFPVIDGEFSDDE
ncbi:MAG: hypothetical protein ACOX4P_06080 [Anaerovoracaceae bacterium]|jgi:hypothetical protein